MQPRPRRPEVQRGRDAQRHRPAGRGACCAQGHLRAGAQLLDLAFRRLATELASMLRINNAYTNMIRAVHGGGPGGPNEKLDEEDEDSVGA